MYKPKNDIILIVDSYEDIISKKSYISLIKLKKVLMKEKKITNNMINFEYEALKGYFENYNLKYIDFQEKKQNVFIIDTNNNLKIFNLLLALLFKYFFSLNFNKRFF